MKTQSVPKKQRYSGVSKFVLLFLLFIPWYIMTLADPKNAEDLDNISNTLMIKSLYGLIIVYLVQIITIFSIDKSMRFTVWEKLYIKENLAVLVLCFTEYWFIWGFIVIMQGFCTVILTTISLFDAILGWGISLILLSPFIYFTRRWL